MPVFVRGALEGAVSFGRCDHLIYQPLMRTTPVTNTLRTGKTRHYYLLLNNMRDTRVDTG